VGEAVGEGGVELEETQVGFREVWRTRRQWGEVEWKVCMEERQRSDDDADHPGSGKYVRTGRR
jgi:hypothetical protein